ncbi:MAG: metalloregulator ArsR/SmtB family transcription factor [Chloroflexota bacterium]
MTSNLPIAATRAAELTRSDVLATFFQGLSDPTRVRILELLAERPRTVTELQTDLGLAQGRISSHLACLRWCGYVVAIVDGRFNRYQLVDPRIREIVAAAESIVRDNADRLTSCLVLGTEGGEPAPIETI